VCQQPLLWKLEISSSDTSDDIHCAESPKRGKGKAERFLVSGKIDVNRKPRISFFFAFRSSIQSRDLQLNRSVNENRKVFYFVQIKRGQLRINERLVSYYNRQSELSCAITRFTLTKRKSEKKIAFSQFAKRKRKASEE